MTIETKYNIGDKVWIIGGSKCRNLTINTIYITTQNKPTVIEYSFDCIVPTVKVNESACFLTKEELIKSL